MVIKLHNTDKWELLETGKVLAFKGNVPRLVRVEFNCVAPTRIDLKEAERGTFLAVVQGHEVIEFTCSGDAELIATSDDEVWFHTDYGDGLAFESFAESFTKLANRRVRNPDLELMMFKAEQRINARLAELDKERAALAAERVSENVGVAPSAGTASGGAVEPAKPAEQSDEGAAPDGDDEKPAVSV